MSGRHQQQPQHQRQQAPGSSGSSADGGADAALAAARAAIGDARLARCVADSLERYQSALEGLSAALQTHGPGAPAHQQLLDCFREALTRAEELKRQQREDSAGAECGHARAKAQLLAEAAVAADGAGDVAAALPLYCQLLDALNRCHSLEAQPPVQAAIMARFQVYLERAEQLRRAPPGGGGR